MLPCAQLAVIRLFLLGGGGVEKGMRCAVGASQKAVRRERERERALVLFCNEGEKREADAERRSVVSKLRILIPIKSKSAVVRILLSTHNFSLQLSPAGFSLVLIW